MRALALSATSDSTISISSVYRVTYKTVILVQLLVSVQIVHPNIIYQTQFVLVVLHYVTNAVHQPIAYFVTLITIQIKVFVSLAKEIVNPALVKLL